MVGHASNQQETTTKIIDIINISYQENFLVKTTGQTVRKETIATVSCPFASYAVLFNQGRVD